MFFGKQINPEISQSLTHDTHQTIQLNNAALSIHSQEAELYLKLNQQEILICEFNRNIGILHHSLNLLIDLKEDPALLVKNGNVHVCGYYQPGKQEATIIDHNQKDQLTLIPIPKGRDHPALNSLNHLEFWQKSSKKSQKQYKKSGQQKARLANGRYNLKTLLQNIDDDDDSDEESSVEFDEEDEDDDSEDDDDFDEDDSESDEERKPKKKVKEGKDDDWKRKLKNQEDTQELEIKDKVHKQKLRRQTDKIVEQSKEQFQAKWPQSLNDHPLPEEQKIQQKIQLLASKLKVPTIKPTF